MLHVDNVSALIVRDARVLLAQRLASDSFPYAWHCPGGKMEEGEDHEQALLRELAEEHAIEDAALLSGTPVWTQEEIVDVAGVKQFLTLRLFLFGLPRTVGIFNREGQGWGWFPSWVVEHLDLTPFTREALPAILDHLRLSAHSG